jgi:radical SAM superfamily enzyme YgiQ (UPF0313 family)
VNNPQFRPPAEAASLILQIDEGCPYNACAFCGMYRGLAFRRRPLAEIRELVEDEARAWPDASRVFLADGDVMSRPFEEVAEILRILRRNLPGLARVNAYATGSGILDKSPAELAQLRSLKLQTLYMGLESGDEATLRRMRKAETAEQMVEAGCRAQAGGLRMSVMVLLGLGGADRSSEHADQTAAALNRMQPRLLSMLRVVPVPGTTLYRDAEAGRFREVTEHGIVEELRRIVAGLALANTVFRSNHVSNVVPLEGRLPKDKTRLLAELDAQLALGNLDRETPGPQPLWL